MTRAPDFSEDKVLKRLLAASDAAAPPAPGSHLADETLALFAEGALRGQERDAAVAHLAACAPCRRVVAVLIQDEHEPVMLRLTRFWPLPGMMTWALAASLLVGVATALVVYNVQRAGPGAGQVAEVPNREGNEKRNASAAPAMPHENALAGGPSGLYLERAGRLTDYGYGLDGRLIEKFLDPFAEQVKELEALPDGNDLQSLCNRGQRLLGWGGAGRV